VSKGPLVSQHYTRSLQYRCDNYINLAGITRSFVQVHLPCESVLVAVPVSGGAGLTVCQATLVAHPSSSAITSAASRSRIGCEYTRWFVAGEFPILAALVSGSIPAFAIYELWTCRRS
jgi:hypothetical protein